MAAIEIEVESEGETCDCCPDCKMAPKGPTKTKDEMLAELKTLLNDSRANGMAERMLQIDKLMEDITDLGEDD
ncbi:MAG: hypothetical protein ACKOQ8_02255 [Micrococcales bacterium]